MRAAYADPPYLGCGAKHYGALHAAAADFDDPETHRRLIDRLCDDFDCWALSLHEPSLRIILPMCPADIRVAVWVKPFAAFKANVTRAWTWEPVIFRLCRDRTRVQDTWRDHISEPIAMRRGFPGAKPDKVCYWIFEGLNLEPDDDFADLFYGSGAVTEAWERWRSRKEPLQFELSQEAPETDKKDSSLAVVVEAPKPPEEVQTPVAIKTCPCGYPMPCSRTVPIGFCRAPKPPEVQPEQNCKRCNGRGRLLITTAHDVTCPRCNGTGIEPPPHRPRC